MTTADDFLALATEQAARDYIGALPAGGLNRLCAELAGWDISFRFGSVHLVQRGHFNSIWSGETSRDDAAKLALPKGCCIQIDGLGKEWSVEVWDDRDNDSHWKLLCEYDHASEPFARCAAWALAQWNLKRKDVKE